MSKRKSILYPFFISFILMLVASCTPASVTAPPQPQPLSTTNPDAFSTFVAGTAEAYMTQTMEAMPTMTATLPPPTETPSPTVTATPTDTNDSTSLSEMEDEAVQFFDYRAGIKLTFPAGWKAVRLSEQEFTDAMTAAEDDPVLQYSMDSVKNLDPIVYRVHAFNTASGYTYEGQGSILAILFMQGDTRELEKIAEEEVQPKELDGYEFIISKYILRTDALEVFVLEENWEETPSTEEKVTVHHKRAVFKVSNGAVFIDLVTPAEVKENALAEFDALVEGLALFTP